MIYQILMEESFPVPSDKQKFVLLLRNLNRLIILLVCPEKLPRKGHEKFAIIFLSAFPLFSQTHHSLFCLPPVKEIDVKNIVTILQKGDVNKDQFAVQLFARVGNFLVHLFFFVECWLNLFRANKLTFSSLQFSFELGRGQCTQILSNQKSCKIRQRFKLIDVMEIQIYLFDICSNTSWGVV